MRVEHAVKTRLDDVEPVDGLLMRFCCLCCQAGFLFRDERYLSYREPDGVNTLFTAAIDRAGKNIQSTDRTETGVGGQPVAGQGQAGQRC